MRVKDQPERLILDVLESSSSFCMDNDEERKALAVTPLLIVCEGGDAAGKYTQTTKLAEKLSATRFAFPNYGSPTGKLILGHLKEEWCCAEENTDPEIDQCLLSCSRIVDARVFQSLQSVNRLEFLPAIQAAFAKGPVVFDRYWQSGYVYGRLDGLEEEWLRQTQEQPMPKATVNILIDVPVETGFERRPERRDRYESNREFMEKVRVEYLSLWGCSGLVWGKTIPEISRFRFLETQPDWFVVYGLDTIDDVHERIMTIVDRYRG